MATLPGPLGAAVRVIIKQAPRLLPQEAEAAAHSGALNPAEFERLAESFATVRGALRGDDVEVHRKAVALVSDGNFATGLITSMAVGADWLCELRQLSGPKRAVAFEALTAVACVTHKLIQPTPSSAAAVAFVRALLRTHALERLSRACAAATACIQELGVKVLESGAPAPAPWAGYLLDFSRALSAVASLIPHLAAVGLRASKVPLPAPPPPSSAADRHGYPDRQREWRRLEVAKRVFVSEFASHLSTSGALELLARGQLIVATVTSVALKSANYDLARELQNVGMTGLQLYVQVTLRLVPLCQAVPPDAAAALVGAMSGPCFRHLTLSAGLAALCAADGGPSYGLNDALLDGLPVMGSARAAPNKLVRDLRILRDNGVPAWLSPSLFCGTVAYLHATAAPVSAVAGAPPVLLDLLLRVGRLTVASACTWAEADAAPGAETDGRFVFDPDHSEEAVYLVCDCLRESDRLLASVAPGGWTGAALLERWRLALDVMRHLTPWLNADSRAGLAKLVAEPLGDGALEAPDGSLPGTPSRTVAAALDAGLVPALESLLRRAGETHAAAVLMHELMSASGCELVMLMRLFAYGQPAELASMFASVAKLLRRCEVRAPAHLPEYRRRGRDWDRVLGSTLLSFATIPHQSPASFLYAASLPVSGEPECAASGAASPRPDASAVSRPTSPAAPVGGSGAHAAQPVRRRLTMALAASALLWRPEQARLARGFLTAVSDPWGLSLQAQQVSETDTLAILLMGPLMWVGLLPFLPESGAAEAGSQAAEAGAAGSGGGGAGGNGGSGWRRFLVEEVGAVSLLAAALQLAPKWRPVAGCYRHSVDSCMMQLAAACAAVALVAPEAVQRAALAGPAVNSDTSAARSRHRGAPSPGTEQVAVWHAQHFADLASKMSRIDAPESVKLALAVGAVVDDWGRGGAVSGKQLAVLRKGLCELLETTYDFDILSAARTLPALQEARAMLMQAGAHSG